MVYKADIFLNSSFYLENFWFWKGVDNVGMDCIFIWLEKGSMKQKSSAVCCQGSHHFLFPLRDLIKYAICYQSAIIAVTLIDSHNTAARLRMVDLFVEEDSSSIELS